MVGREILRHAGELLRSDSEISHVTLYYRTRLGSMQSKELECTSNYCRSKGESPITVIKYERDHMAQEWFDAFCNSCAPAMFRLILSEK